ncbi:MAG: septum formation inhibitor Maf [Rhodocyclaceae bacterium]|nr:septum formation inhibitor Maf [Rhodocyclaceae bacterium]
MTHTTQRIVLASTSPFRRELLGRLRLAFEIANPVTDETPLPSEAPEATAIRLAVDKAKNVASRFPDALIIGSDQVAHANGRNYGKPGTRENAIAHLAEMSGRCIVFHTAVSLHNSHTGQTQTACVPTSVGFRTLTAPEIERYVDADQPLNCAGSARSESLGVSLLEYMRGDDPTALIGLPLIKLCQMLRNEGIALP